VGAVDNVDPVSETCTGTLRTAWHQHKGYNNQSKYLSSVKPQDVPQARRHVMAVHFNTTTDG